MKFLFDDRENRKDAGAWAGGRKEEGKKVRARISSAPDATRREGDRVALVWFLLPRVFPHFCLRGSLRRLFLSRDIHERMAMAGWLAGRQAERLIDLAVDAVLSRCGPAARDYLAA